MEVETKYGTMTLELFDDVPLHAANFRYKVERGYYRPSEFVRVVPEFVVQGGNSEDRGRRRCAGLSESIRCPVSSTIVTGTCAVL